MGASALVLTAIAGLTALSIVKRKNVDELEFNEGLDIQSVVFNREQHTILAAKRWCEDRGFEIEGTDSTDTWLIFEIFNLWLCENDSLELFEVDNGVYAIVCRLAANH